MIAYYSDQISLIWILIDLGSGSDTVVFSSAYFDGTVIDLGSDNQGI